MSEWGNPPECLLLLLRNDAPRRPLAGLVNNCEVTLIGINRYFWPEYIGLKERTRGTETSQYPQERKSTDTPLVVASERGPAEPMVLAEPAGMLGEMGESPVCDNA